MPSQLQVLLCPLTSIHFLFHHMIQDTHETLTFPSSFLKPHWVLHLLSTFLYVSLSLAHHYHQTYSHSFPLMNHQGCCCWVGSTTRVGSKEQKVEGGEGRRSKNGFSHRTGSGTRDMVGKKWWESSWSLSKFLLFFGQKVSRCVSLQEMPKFLVRDKFFASSLQTLPHHLNSVDKIGISRRLTPQMSLPLR